MAKNERLEAIKNMIKIEPKSSKTGTEIVVILDRSGSMQSIADDARGGFNSFLKTQKELPDDGSTLTLILFDHEYDVIYDRMPISDVPELNKHTFIPRGQTALLDAIGKTIELVEDRNSNKKKKIIFAILTDGEENHSRRFSRDQIFNKISRKKDDQWEFIFLAANQDAIANGMSLGFNNEHISNFSASTRGVKGLSRVMCDSISSYRTMGVAGAMPTWADDAADQEPITFTQTSNTNNTNP